MAEYIDKQTVLDIITEYEKAQIKQKGIPITGVASIAIEIEDLPAADVRENKTGYWIKTEDGLIRCSECGHSRGELIAVHKPVDNDYVSKGGVLFNLVWENPYFCGKCGADMRKTCDGDQGREVEL